MLVSLCKLKANSAIMTGIISKKLRPLSTTAIGVSIAVQNVLSMIKWIDRFR